MKRKVLRRPFAPERATGIKKKTDERSVHKPSQVYLTEDEQQFTDCGLLSCGKVQHVGGYRRFGGTWCLHLRSWNIYVSELSYAAWLDKWNRFNKNFRFKTVPFNWHHFFFYRERKQTLFRPPVLVPAYKTRVVLEMWECIYISVCFLTVLSWSEIAQSVRADLSGIHCRQRQGYTHISPPHHADQTLGPPSSLSTGTGADTRR